jgi:hypothetical protein
MAPTVNCSVAPHMREDGSSGNVDDTVGKVKFVCLVCSLHCVMAVFELESYSSSFIDVAIK